MSEVALHPAAIRGGPAEPNTTSESTPYYTRTLSPSLLLSLSTSLPSLSGSASNKCMQEHVYVSESLRPLENTAD